MLDVHAPHSPLHGTKEFLFHLFTITVGLLIATQIESCVEWRHHVHLAQEARSSLREEIEHNLKDLRQAEPALLQWRKEIDADLASMGRIQERGQNGKDASISVNSHAITLRDTAWRTAQTTGALAYMPYDEAQRYASIYQAQTDLLALQQKPNEDVANILGLISKFHWGPHTAIRPEQAADISEQLGRMQLHLATGSALLKENLEVNAAFLEGREAKGNFSETLQ